MESVAYENTLYSLMIKQFKGKYFQNILNHALVIHIPKKNEFGIHFIENRKFSVWMPFNGEKGGWGVLSLEDFSNYAEISKEQFKKYEINKNNLSNIILAHKDSEFIKSKQNKANLSAQSERDNPRMKNYFKMLDDPLRKDSYFP